MRIIKGFWYKCICFFLSLGKWIWFLLAVGTHFLLYKLVHVAWVVFILATWIMHKWILLFLGCKCILNLIWIIFDWEEFFFLFLADDFIWFEWYQVANFLILVDRNHLIMWRRFCNTMWKWICLALRNFKIWITIWFLFRIWRLTKSHCFQMLFELILVDHDFCLFSIICGWSLIFLWLDEITNWFWLIFRFLRWWKVWWFVWSD